jgi:thymidylate synthase
MGSNDLSALTSDIASDNVDDLVVKGIQYIKKFGETIEVIAGKGVQAYAVNYILLDSRQRLHNLRYPKSIRYFCRELVAFFRGSLNIDGGLEQASSLWREVADEQGRINSNYGYYVFYQKTGGQTQYDWVISNLKRNRKSRRSLININQPYHKSYCTKDFPCTIAVQFLVRQNQLCCEVYSRSEDVVLGLPNDIGFFSFLNELVCADLNRYTGEPLNLGYTMIRCSFTQIYDKTAQKAEEILSKHSQAYSYSTLYMPLIDDVANTLADIYQGTQESKVMRWIVANTEL